jgi:lipopolysaccharide transport system permease protein
VGDSLSNRVGAEAGVVRNPSNSSGPLRSSDPDSGSEIFDDLTLGPRSEAGLVIEPGHIDRDYWKDIWRYRELFRTLAWRDISVRYKQTIIGATWAVIRPVLGMGVFTIVFGRLAHLPSQGTPYPLLVFVGMLPWMLFSTALTDASNSLISNANLLTKVYFPRLIVPGAAVMISLVDLLISLAALVLLLGCFMYLPSWQVVFLPVFIVLAVAASFGPSLWITALNVKYRDFRYIIPFVVQFGLYVSPVGFSSNIVPDQWRLLYSLNPMVGVIEGFRWSILGAQNTLYLPGILTSTVISAIMLYVGIRQFRKMERSFADII